MADAVVAAVLRRKNEGNEWPKNARIRTSRRRHTNVDNSNKNSRFEKAAANIYNIKKKKSRNKFIMNRDL